jgi:hypothetical protein
MRQAMLHERWIDQYGQALAERLEPERRYSLLRVGAAEFAYTTYDGYLRALDQAWNAGFVPEPLGLVEGSRLLEVVPNLRDIDADLGNLQTSDVERSSRFS